MSSVTRVDSWLEISHPGLAHHRDRARILAVRLVPGRLLDTLAAERPYPALGHLRAAGVAGTQEQYAGFVHVDRLGVNRQFISFEFEARDR